MTLYTKLRRLYSQPLEERLQILEREMTQALDKLDPLLADLEPQGLASVKAVHGERNASMVEIMQESAANLRRHLASLSQRNLQERETLRHVRHDLRGPLGTLRGATVVLSRLDAKLPGGAPIAERAGTALALCNDMRDILEALTEEHDRPPID